MRTGKPLAPARERVDHGGPPVIVVKTSTVTVLMQAAGWTKAELSRHARLDAGAVGRLLLPEGSPDRIRPGQRSIGGLILAFNTRFPKIGFHDLFDVVEEDGSLIAPLGEAETDDSLVTPTEEDDRPQAVTA